MLSNFHFPQGFKTFYKRIIIVFLYTYELSSANPFNLQQSIILSFGKELTHSHTMTPFDAPGKQAF